MPPRLIYTACRWARTLAPSARQHAALAQVQQERVKAHIQSVNSFTGSLQVQQVFLEQGSLANHVSWFTVSLKYFQLDNPQQPLSACLIVPEVSQTLAYLRENMESLSDNQFLSVLTNLAKATFLEEQWLHQALREIQNRKVILDTRCIEYLMQMMVVFEWSGSNELSTLVKQVQQKMHLIPLQHMTSLFQLPAMLEYSYPSFFLSYEPILIKNSPRFQADQVLSILEVYHNSPGILLPNYDLFDQLALRLLRISSSMTISQMQSTVSLFKELDYSNEMLFQSLSVKIQAHLQPFLLQNHQQNDQNNDLFQQLQEQDDEYHSEEEIEGKAEEEYTHSTKINIHGKGVSFPTKQNYISKAEFKADPNENAVAVIRESFSVEAAAHMVYQMHQCDYRDQALLGTVELYLLQNIMTCDLRALLEITLVKKHLLQELLEEYQVNKDQYYHRSLKRVKKYFNFLYEAAMPVVLLRLDELSLLQVQSLLESALLETPQKGRFYKNETRRQLIKLGTQGLPKRIGESQDKVAFDLLRTMLRLSFGDKKLQGEVMAVYGEKGWDVKELQYGWGDTVVQNGLSRLEDNTT